MDYSLSLYINVRAITGYNLQHARFDSERRKGG